MARVYNFSAGPSMLPEKVLRQAQAELLEYGDSGQSVMEMSHRSKWFDAIIKDTEASLRRVMNIPDNYKVGFFQGGATQQFAMVPLNFMTTGKADYIVSGNFSGLAAKEAAKFGEAKIVASSKDKNFTYIPDVNAINYDKDASYIHICQNNTIFGTQYVELPQVEGVPLVADMSSMILSKPVDVSKYGCIYFGVQKNVAPAGMAIAIIRDDLLGHAADNSKSYRVPWLRDYCYEDLSARIPDSNALSYWNGHRSTLPVSNIHQAGIAPDYGGRVHSALKEKASPHPLPKRGSQIASTYS